MFPQFLILLQILFQVTTLTRSVPWPLASQCAVLELVLIEVSSSSPPSASSHSPTFPLLSSWHNYSKCKSHPTSNPSRPIRSFCPSSNCRALPPVLWLEGVVAMIQMVVVLGMTMMPTKMMILFDQYHHLKDWRCHTNTYGGDDTEDDDNDD